MVRNFSIFRIFHSYRTDKYPMKDINLLFDASGFVFSDQHYKSDVTFTSLNNYYKTMKEQGTKIFFLPQAFGPFKTENGKKQAELLKKYADCVMAREEMSYTHLINAGIDKKKILLYPDFTALVEGIFPAKFEYLKNGIAIIPNLRMIDKGAISKNDYIDMLIKTIVLCETAKKTVFFLNHEGRYDFKLCKDINNKLNKKLPIVSGLTALEIKGLISRCYFVFSSRFHGLVSTLSSGVPCLATSWSHKYEMLFKDYDMEECSFKLNDKDSFYQKLAQFLDVDFNNAMRDKLNIRAESIKDKIREMWEQVWERIE
jgi:colanic acid/amylovoran biosynthesis protein